MVEELGGIGEAGGGWFHKLVPGTSAGEEWYLKLVMQFWEQ
jgi:hypothetical protein